MNVRTISIFAAILCTAALFGCAKQKETEPREQTPESAPVTSVPEEEESEEGTEVDLSGLSDERFDGYTYRIIVRKGRESTQYYDEQQDDVVADAIYRRNKAVEEKYGIEITCAEGEGADTDMSALNSILAGDDAYDAIFTHSRSAFAYALQGAGLNIHDIDSIHLDEPWWSKNLVESCTINGKLYVLDGDLSLSGVQGAVAMFFNKRIMDELGFDYPYESVRNGTWLFDDFAYLVRKGGKDLNGDGIILPEDDQFGFVGGDWTSAIDVLYAGGQKIYEKDEAGELQLTLYSDKTVRIFDKYFSLVGSESVYHQVSKTPTQTFVENVFDSGRAMFTARSLGTAQGFRNMQDDFGIVPFPKFDEDDDYGTIVDGYSDLIVIPITVADPHRTGVITEALAAYGSKYVIPAFYDVSLKGKYARDVESEEMMDLIRESIVFDIGYVCGGTFQSVGCALARSETHDFASYYAAGKDQALSDLAAFVKDYGKE